jgi:hypothetical protein
MLILNPYCIDTKHFTKSFFVIRNHIDGKALRFTIFVKIHIYHKYLPQ